MRKGDGIFTGILGGVLAMSKNFCNNPAIRNMAITLKTKLVASFLVVVLIMGGVTIVIGIRVIDAGILRQAQEKVRLDLNSAREMYQHKLQMITQVIALTGQKWLIRDALIQGQDDVLRERLADMQISTHLDVLTVTDRNGVVLFRTNNPARYGDSQADDELVRRVLATKQTVFATEILPQSELLKEGDELARRAQIRILTTPMARPRQEIAETSGMVLKAAAPILSAHDELIGVVYGGVLLNQNTELVDEIRDTVYQNAQYQGKNEGTATIFQGNLRIATNVFDSEGKRAIGTLVSEEVHRRVLDRGEQWISRAFVVNDWYISAYEPIRGLEGEILGILYVGMLEQRFADLKSETLLLFVGITIIGAILAMGVAYVFATDFLKPITRLESAAHKLSTGNFTHRIEPISRGELGELEETFNMMVTALQQREASQKDRMLRQLLQSEKLAALGRLAAGVAHQINNPLTTILTYSSLLLKMKPADDPDREDLQMIVDETIRCRDIVKSLLGFSKQTEAHKTTLDINDILLNALTLTRNQAQLNHIEVITELSDNLPQLVVDATQMQEAVLNILINAIDAMPQGGALHVKSEPTDHRQQVLISLADTGQGISPEHLDKVFDPFFTTKGAKGTGLGLAVVYGVIEKHQGTIRMESTVGKGTTCYIELPVVRTIEEPGIAEA